MKRFYNNTIMSGALSKALRVVALLCVLLGFSASAWGAKAGLWRDNVIVVKINGTDISMGNNYTTHALGTIASAPSITGAEIRVWKNGNGNICSDDVKLNVDGTDYSRNSDMTFMDNNNYKFTININKTFANTAGDHTITLYAKAKGNENGSEGCNNSWQSTTCKITYTIGAQNYYLKHPWDGSNWTWKELTYQSGTTYTLTANYGGNNATVDYNTANKDDGKVNVTPTLGCTTIAQGTSCTFTFDSNSKTVNITPTAGCGSDDDDDDDSGECQTLYLEPTDHWNKDGARFAAYFYGGGPAETWVDMKGSTCNGLFKVAVPNSAYTNVIFVRMNGATSENNWNNKWNQTNDLSLNHSNNLYTITNIGGGKQHSSGNWSTTSCDDKADCSGTGGDDEPDNCDYVEIWARGKGSYTDIYCNVASATAQSTGIKSYNGNNYATWIVTTKTAIAVSFCAGNKHEYCTNTGSMEPGNRYYCEFAAEGWRSQDYTITLTEPLDCNEKQTAVLLSKQALVNKTAGKATLYGYLSSTNCDKQIAEYGFYYCRVIDGNKCKPTASSYKLQVSPSEALLRGQEFSAELEVEDGYTYYYRAYAKINDVDVLSAETRLISTDPCVQQVCCGEPVVYTINADPDFMENVCKLHFTSLQDAIDHLKNSASRTDAYQYVEKVGSSYNLKQPVVMNVVYYDDTPDDDEKAYAYRGTTAYGMTAGNVTPTNVNLIEDINKTASNSANTLTIKAGTSKAKPWIHHIVIRNSRNIVLDSLCIYSDPTGLADNAMEFDLNSTWWDGIGGPNAKDGSNGSSRYIPILEDANILVQNCMIGSAGFTGVHFSGYDGITFKNNDFEAQYSQAESDDTSYRTVINYGASAKFISCKNIKFIQNNFRGSHPTLMWLQECSNVLVMNNVFWNTNTLQPSNTNLQRSAALRLVHQFNNQGKPNVSNVSAFYNTFYLAESENTKDNARYDFLYFSNTVDNGSGSSSSNFDLATIKFQYNNCYSYDKKVLGKSNGTRNLCNNNKGTCADVNEPFLGLNLSNSANFCPNNFWSQYDQDKLDKGETVAKSAFAFGCSENDFVNVKGQVCETTASGPASLIVKGTGMDYGVKPDISTTGITLEPNEQYADRYLIGARPADGEKWTYGAYQSKDNIDTKVIYWVGVTDDWDDRNNWEYETEVDGKMVRQRVSCVNNFSEDLKVVIEEIGTVEVTGGRKWPQIPASFTENRKNSEYDEHVSAGLGTGKTPTKFASTIELEYGAGIKGVENLREADGTLRYDRAITHFDAPRDKWLLVGTVVKPFVDEQAGTTRNIISRDYYMDFLPQVYMRQTVVDGDQISWTKTFPDLDTEVQSTTVFAINAVNKYGPSFQEAVDYNAANGTNYDGTAPIPYTFTGRFAVEEERDNAEELYAFTISNGKNLLNNNYPCNLDAKALEDEYDGTVNLYDYKEGAFVSTTADSPDGNVYIKAQNGFVFIPNKNGQSKIEPSNFLVEGSTRTRSVERELPTFSLNVDNANTTQPGASNVVIRYDQEQEAFFEAPLNTPKVFTKNLYTPEVYIINNDAFYSRLYVGNGVTQVPLGLRLLRAMNVTFQKVYNEQFATMILVDTKTGKEYDLLARDYTTEKLPKDTIEGRFYLKFAVEEQDDFQEDDDFVTDITDVTDASINIYAVDQQIIKVIANDVELQTIYVNDMTGRMMRYDASGSYAELQLPVAQGVYLVHVIGDKATRTEKVILK